MPKASDSDVHTSSSDAQLSRREFARRAVLVATTATLAPTALLGQQKQSGNPAAPASPQTGLSPQLQAEGELKYQWVLQTYGSRLSAEEKKDLHRLILEGQKPLAAFRAFPLENADMPATVLKFTDAESEQPGGRD